MDLLVGIHIGIGFVDGILSVVGFWVVDGIAEGDVWESWLLLAQIGHLLKNTCVERPYEIKVFG